MLLEAHSLGLGACWIAIYGEGYEASAKKLLDVPKNERLICAIAIGHPAETGRKIKRKLGEVSFTDRYGR